MRKQPRRRRRALRRRPWPRPQRRCEHWRRSRRQQAQQAGSSWSALGDSGHGNPEGSAILGQAAHDEVWTHVAVAGHAGRS